MISWAFSRISFSLGGIVSGVSVGGGVVEIIVAAGGVAWAEEMDEEIEE